MIAGRDLRSGGAWLGISEEGRFAVVTNLAGYGPPAADPPSRDALVKDVLAGTGTYNQPTTAKLAAFNSVNLLTVVDGQARLMSNRPDREDHLVSSGRYGLSNGPLGEESSRARGLKSAVQAWLDADLVAPDFLFDVLQDAGQSSPIFIRDPIYGTRCSTVVVIDYSGRGRIVERRFDQAGDSIRHTCLAFSWPAM